MSISSISCSDSSYTGIFRPYVLTACPLCLLDFDKNVLQSLPLCSQTTTNPYHPALLRLEFFNVPLELPCHSLFSYSKTPLNFKTHAQNCITKGQFWYHYSLQYSQHHIVSIRVPWRPVLQDGRVPFNLTDYMSLI